MFYPMWKNKMNISETKEREKDKVVCEICDWKVLRLELNWLVVTRSSTVSALNTSEVTNPLFTLTLWIIGGFNEISGWHWNFTNGSE